MSNVLIVKSSDTLGLERRGESIECQFRLTEGNQDIKTPAVYLSLPTTIYPKSPISKGNWALLSRASHNTN